ncbi:O-methylsterigmatocystin oxidoreductase [Hypsizygus marmoreus]|uniref:O-methylsterigmatocystin oxidoreductase n=1 Tax=Hypsizygus marmoreus TaxID=39966 RepID=A0A369JAM8_HYPMA|nr:O-methylsterigmatocystin oxidoreductase [Hypsizygus marmoreus]
MALLVFLLTCAFLSVWVKLKRKKYSPLPPGPPPEPLLGHLRLIPGDHQDALFYEWGKIYGDVFHLRVLGRSIIVLNSAEAAVDLLDKRSANYSDRPHFVVFELMGWMRSLTFMGYGKLFQRHRRLLQGHLNSKKCETYHPIQARETRVLLQNLVLNEEGRDDFIRRFSTAIIMRVAYGHQITSDDDPYIDITEHASHALGNVGAPGSTPVDYFPFLRYLPSWFPGTFYAGFARDNKTVIDTMHDYPFARVQKDIAEGKGKPSFVADHLEKMHREGLVDPDALVDIKGAAAVMYCAGAETTWSTLSYFFFAMVLHPECQRRAQDEIDAVIGFGRLPEFNDRLSLPYVESVFQEVLRWHGAVPLGVPHLSMEDDIYRGMFIPKRSLIIANTRGMTLDERVYADPHTFNPTRYLPKPEGNNEPHPVGPFGFGRRICPGRHLADASVWIAIASILATLTISKATSDDGKEITPELSLSNGIVSQLQPYKCRIRPRNERARSLIIQADIWDDY